MSMFQGLASAMQSGSAFDQHLRDASPLLAAMGADYSRGTPGQNTMQGIAGMMAMKDRREQQAQQAEQQQRLQQAVAQLPPQVRQQVMGLPPEAQAQVLGRLATQQPKEQDPYAQYRVVGGSLLDLGAEGGPAPVYNAPETPQRDSAADQRIARLMATGLDYNTAVGIADGRLATSRDPISGAVQVVDKATGNPVGGQPQQAGARGASQPSVPQDVDYTSALGGEGIAAGMANTVADFFGGQLPAPQAERASQALDNLRVRTMTGLQDAVPGRPSNYLLQQLETLAIKPGSMSMGPERARERLSQTRDMVADAIRTNEQILQYPEDFTPQQRSAARLKINELTPLMRDYQAIINTMGERQIGAPQTTTEGAPAAPQGAPQQIQSKEQFDALPSGALFTAPDGSVRRKP